VGPIFPEHPVLDFLPVPEGTFFLTYPDGLADVLTLAGSYHLPVIVTENGAMNPASDAGETFLVPHLEALWKVLQAGVDVRGYCYWSLVDNYEWNLGMQARFGLYELDLATKARTLRPIGARLAEIAKANGF
jgi:beta-glucosidase